jgi:hypothetical protein
MGFGALFLGIMFLYDVPIFLAHSSSEAAYIALDIFPDAIGWILFFFGLRSLSKKAEGFEKLRFVPLFMLVLSLLSLLKDTLFFSSFYTMSEKNVQQIFAGISFDVCLRVLEIGFLVLLFSKTAKVCKKSKEEKIASAHGMSARIAIVEGILFVISSLLGAFGQLPSVVPVLSGLENLFMVFLVWYGAISMVRAMLRVSE